MTSLKDPCRLLPACSSVCRSGIEARASMFVIASASRRDPVRAGPKSRLPRREAPRKDERWLPLLWRVHSSLSFTDRHRERSEATQFKPARSLGCLVAKLLARTNDGYPCFGGVFKLELYRSSSRAQRSDPVGAGPKSRLLRRAAPRNDERWSSLLQGAFKLERECSSSRAQRSDPVRAGPKSTHASSRSPSHTRTMVIPAAGAS